VPAHLLDEDRMIRGDFVQIPPVQRTEIRRLRVVIAHAPDPLPGRFPQGFLEDDLFYIRNRTAFLRAAVELEQVRPVLEEMLVGIDEPGATVRPFRAMTSVFRPARARTSASPPAIRNRPFLIATASASGLRGSTVMTLPPQRIRSAAASSRNG